VISSPLVRSHAGETFEEAHSRAAALRQAWPTNAASLEAADVSILRELFGPAFLTPNYYLKQSEYVELER
jgi:hypothetical protein